MTVAQWVAVCIVVAVVAAIVMFLLTTWGFLSHERSLPQLPAASETFLPAEGITADNIRELRFASERRGYNRGEVDWVLARIAADYAGRSGTSDGSLDNGCS